MPDRDNACKTALSTSAALRGRGCGGGGGGRWLWKLTLSRRFPWANQSISPPGLPPQTFPFVPMRMCNFPSHTSSHCRGCEAVKSPVKVCSSHFSNPKNLPSCQHAWVLSPRTSKPSFSVKAFLLIWVTCADKHSLLHALPAVPIGR